MKLFQKQPKKFHLNHAPTTSRKTIQAGNSTEEGLNNVVISPYPISFTLTSLSVQNVDPCHARYEEKEWHLGSTHRRLNKPPQAT